MPTALYLFVGILLLLTVIPVWITISDELESRKNTHVLQARWEPVDSEGAKSSRGLSSPTQTTRAEPDLTQRSPSSGPHEDLLGFIAKACGPVRIAFPNKPTAAAGLPHNYRRGSHFDELQIVPALHFRCTVAHGRLVVVGFSDDVVARRSTDGPNTSHHMALR